MEKKQTAVEWFISVLSHNDILDHKKVSSNKQLYNLYLRLKEQALEMEREQITDSYIEGHSIYGESTNAEQHYTETFGGQDETL